VPAERRNKHKSQFYKPCGDSERAASEVERSVSLRRGRQTAKAGKIGGRITFKSSLIGRVAKK
jgi:hypothetical protein